MVSGNAVYLLVVFKNFTGEVYGSNFHYSKVVRKTSGDIFFGKLVV